jgi:ABC-type glycerol-3-phosphate transport system permease component
MGHRGNRLLVHVSSWRLLPAAIFVLPQVYVLKALPALPPAACLVLLVALQLVPLNTLVVAPFAVRAHDRFHEVAMLDGASDLCYVTKILLPRISVPASFAFSITFLLAWTEFFTPAVLITSRKDWTLPIFLSQYITSYSTIWGELYASAALTAGLGLAISYGLSSGLRMFSTEVRR